MQPLIETPRLLLREVKPSDAPGFFEMDSDPMVVRYTGAPPVADVSESLKIIEFIQSQYVVHGIGRWTVLLKETGEFLGWCGLKRFADAEINGRRDFVDLGYRFSQRHWGKGYATEAAGACLRYGFETRGYDLICAHAMQANTASVHVLTKIGMLDKGIFEAEGEPCVWFEALRQASDLASSQRN
jgi:[ribosomal protein S5]-alanine N-acetyltransferase